ncbi:hypothetical protein BO443_120084 [Burkholderia orbicola]
MFCAFLRADFGADLRPISARISASGARDPAQCRLPGCRAKRFVSLDVTLRHCLRAETRVETLADRGARQAVDPVQRADRALHVLDDEAGHAVLDHFRHGAAVERDDRRAAGHRLDHHQAERLRPVDREQQRLRAGQERRLLCFVDLADEFDVRLAEQRLDHFLEVVGVGLVDLRGDLQRQPALRGDADRGVDALFGTDPAEEREVFGLHVRLRREQRVGQPVVHGAGPRSLRQRLALVVRDRHDRRIRERVEHRLQLRQVEAPVQRRHVRRVEARHQRERQVVEVEVQHVEFVRDPGDLLEEPHMGRHRIADRRVEPQCARPCRLETGRRDGVAAGEQRHVMAEFDERLGEVGHDTLGAAVEFRRDGFVKRRDLGNSHGCSPVSIRGAMTPRRIPYKVAELADARGWRYVAGLWTGAWSAGRQAAGRAGTARAAAHWSPLSISP